MKKSIWTRLLGIGMTATLTIGVLTGCGEEKKVDYTIEGVTREGSSQSIGGKSGLAQFEEEEVWVETWMSETGEWDFDGEMHTLMTNVRVDAKVTVPKAGQMSVVEVVETEFDAKFKEMIAENIFDSGEIYYGDESHLPKEDSEAYTPVEDYTVDEYIGSCNGQMYHLSFVETAADEYDYGQRQMVWTPKDLYQVCPDNFKEKENLQCSPWMMGDWVENSCQMSEEEALKEAKAFVEKLGTEYPVVSHTYPLAWGNVPENTSMTSEMESKDWGIDGYVFSFDLGVDDISFVDYGVGEDYKHSWYYGASMDKINDNTEKEFSLNARLEIYVTDQGVIRMIANNPMEITGISEGVELLPLDTVKRIIKEELNEQWQTFLFDSSEKYFDDMELIYFRVRDKENEGKYSYVPVWRLAGVTRDTIQNKISIRNPVLINAIDGSIILDYEEM